MKFWLILMVFFASLAQANDDLCKPIQDKDQRNFCYATENKEKFFCYLIGEHAYKHLCLAQVKNQKAPCFKIHSTEAQQACLNAVK
jgi:hypothetical protein